MFDFDVYNINKSFEDMALEFATECHIKQRRKFTNDPYIFHPISVANLVAMYVYNYEYETVSNMICASYLHDVVEDTSIKIEDIFHTFGAEVCVLVDQLTTPNIRGINKGGHLLIKMINMDENALIIKLCDRYDNILGLNEDCVSDQFKSRYYKETKHIINGLKVINTERYNYIHIHLIDKIDSFLRSLHEENNKIFN